MSLGTTKNPTGGAGSRHVMERHSLNPVTVAQVLEKENLQKAWKQVKANKGAPGIDNISIEEFPEYAFRHWEGIKTALLEGTYQPSPVKRVEIPKDSGGGSRPLGIPTVLDRVIEQAISQVLTPVFDPHFSEYSYGFRPNRSAHQAVRKVEGDIRQGYRYAVDIDLEKFFDSVDFDVLMSRVARRVRDKGLLCLIGKYLRAGVVVDGRLIRTVRGVPQGSPLSPLLSNILLDDFDKELERRKHRFARYADDGVILVKSKRAGERVMAGITRYLGKLKVKVNTDKSRVVRVQDCSFLGFTFKGRKVTATVKAIRGFKRRVRRLTGRSWGISMSDRYGHIQTYVRGWMNYFGIGVRYTDAVELDHWLRRRIRMCYLKQWGRARKRIGELIRLGSPKHQAILTGLSRKGYWHLAKTYATNCGLSKEYLQDQGLVSLRTLWIGIHYPAKAR
jgi:RNA-directed DNA polymerase